MEEKVRLDYFWGYYRTRRFNSVEKKIQWLLLVLMWIVIHQPKELVKEAIAYANKELNNSDNVISKYIN